MQSGRIFMAGVVPLAMPSKEKQTFFEQIGTLDRNYPGPKGKKQMRQDKWMPNKESRERERESKSHVRYGFGLKTGGIGCYLQNARSLLQAPTKPKCVLS